MQQPYTVKKKNIFAEGRMHPLLQKIIKPAGVFLLGLLVAALAYFVAIQPLLEKTTMVSSEPEITGKTDIIQNGSFIQQTFTGNKNVTGMELLVATNGVDILDVTWRGNLYDVETDLLVATFDEKMQVIKDNSTIQAEFSNMVELQGATYRLDFWFENLTEDDRLIFWLTDSPEFLLLVDGEEQTGSSVINWGENSGYLATYYWMLALPAVALLTLVWFLLFSQKAKIETVFAVIAIGVGLLLMFVYPPYAMYDETSHTQSVLSQSSKLFGEKVVDGKIKIRKEDNINGFTAIAPKREQYYHIYNNFFKMAESPRETNEISYLMYGKIYQYIPQILGVTIARLAGWGQVPTLYMGKVFGLLAYVGMVYLAIRLTPFKTMFALCGLFPATLAIAGTFSYDTSIIALCFLFLGYVTYLIYTKLVITLPDLGLLLIIGLLIVPLKYIYIPLLLLTVLIPQYKWNYPRLKGIFVLSLIMVGVVIVLGTIGVTIYNSFLADAGDTPWMHEEGSYTFKLIFSNGKEFWRIFVNTVIDDFGENINMPAQVHFNKLPLAVSIVAMILPAISVFEVKGETPLLVKKSHKIAYISLFVLVYTAAIIVALQWTYRGAYYIQGAQPRYYLPIVPLLFLGIYNVFQRTKNNDRELLFAMFLVNIYSAWYLFQAGSYSYVVEKIIHYL